MSVSVNSNMITAKETVVRYCVDSHSERIRETELGHTVTPDNAAAAPTIAYKPGMTPWQKRAMIKKKHKSKRKTYNLLSLRKNG